MNREFLNKKGFEELKDFYKALEELRSWENFDSQEIDKINSNSIALISGLSIFDSTASPTSKVISDFIEHMINSPSGKWLKPSWEIFALCVLLSFDENRTLQIYTLLDSCLPIAVMNFISKGSLINCDQMIREKADCKRNVLCDNCKSNNEKYPCFKICNRISFYLRGKKEEKENAIWHFIQNLFGSNKRKNTLIKSYYIPNFKSGFETELISCKLYEQNIHIKRNTVAHGNLRQLKPKTNNTYINDIYVNKNNIIIKELNNISIPSAFIFLKYISWLKENEYQRNFTELYNSEILHNPVSATVNQDENPF